MPIPFLSAILPFLGKAAAGLLAGGKAIGGAALAGGKVLGSAALAGGKTMLPNILSMAAQSLLGSGAGGQQGQAGQTGQQQDIVSGQQMPPQMPQNLFEYQPRNISLALQKLLQQSRGF